MKKILVAAGTSVNKMNSAAETIKKMCESKNVQVEVVAENIYEVDLNKISPDLIVLLGANQLSTDLPVVDGVPFITTMGMDAAIDQIISKLNG